MMRPARCFIMPRKTALEARNTDLRLTCMMSSHSSSFIRIRRLSRVMPALLTRISNLPNSFSMSAIRFSMVSGSAEFKARPSPPHCAKRSLIAAAPLSLVAVPMTLAPAAASVSAIAAPIPRDAPVTNATLPLKSCVLMFTSLFWEWSLLISDDLIA